MALIKLGQIAADIRGSIGGTTFARNRAGAFARNRTKPINPSTVKQSDARSRFGGVSFAWAALTQVQRDAWQAVAATITRLNRLGETYVPTGRQMFLEVNNNAALVGDPLLTTAPDDFQAPEPPHQPDIVLTVTAGSITVFTAEVGGVDPMIVFATPPLPATKNNVQPHYRFLGYLTPAAGIIDLEPDYVAAYGAAVAPGMLINISVQSLNQVNYVSSARVLANAITT